MGALDVSANDLIDVVAQDLKKNYSTLIVSPEWVMLVKSSAANERVPSEPDFFYKRCASILLTSYKRGTIGVQRLRRKYGGRTQHIVRRSHHRKAGGKVIRVALQQLEKAGLMNKEKAGRSISAKGKSLLDKASSKVQKGE